MKHSIRTAYIIRTPFRDRVAALQAAGGRVYTDLSTGTYAAGRTEVLFSTGAIYVRYDHRER